VLGISRTGSLDVTRLNPRGRIYVNTDPSAIFVEDVNAPEGSFRFTSEGDDVRIDKKTNGSWNLAGLLIGQASVLFGRQLKASGAGGRIQTTEFNTGLTALIPHVPYTTAGTEQPNSPVYAKQIVKEEQTPAVDIETLAGGVGGFWTPPNMRVITSVFIYIGHLAPVQPLLLTIKQGLTGPIVYQQEYPADEFPPSLNSSATNDGGDALFTAVGNTLAFNDDVLHLGFTESTYNGRYVVTFVSGDTYKLGITYVLDDTGTLGSEVEILMTGGGFLSDGTTPNFWSLAVNPAGPPGLEFGRNSGANVTWFALTYYPFSTVDLLTNPGTVTRLTATATLALADYNVFGNTDAGDFTVTLPPGVEGAYHRIVNTGVSGNQLTIAPDGLDLLLRENDTFILNDQEALIIVYESTDGWE
jgi:hypothetical protein